MVGGLPPRGSEGGGGSAQTGVATFLPSLWYSQYLGWTLGGPIPRQAL